jgi:hypothetical protein
LSQIDNDNSDFLSSIFYDSWTLSLKLKCWNTRVSKAKGNCQTHKTYEYLWTTTSHALYISFDSFTLITLHSKTGYFSSSLLLVNSGIFLDEGSDSLQKSIVVFNIFLFCFVKVSWAFYFFFLWSISLKLRGNHKQCDWGLHFKM